jgi:hypothetical protein
LATDSVSLLFAIERGDGAEVERLARAVAAPIARLTLEVLAGGPFVVARALELADAIAPDHIDVAVRADEVAS